jgi:hypothetical protein
MSSFYDARGVPQRWRCPIDGSRLSLLSTGPMPYSISGVMAGFIAFLVCWR